MARSVEFMVSVTFKSPDGGTLRAQATVKEDNPSDQDFADACKRNFNPLFDQAYTSVQEQINGGQQ